MNRELPPAFRLRCEYLDEPLGIDIGHPRLQWTVPVGDGRSVPTHVQIQVSAHPARTDRTGFAADDAPLWDSGKTVAPSPWLTYAGPALRSSTIYSWRVRYWLSGGEASAWSQPATFGTGLFEPDQFRASWITAAEWTPYVQKDLVLVPEIEEVHARYFACDFHLEKQVRRCFVHVCGLGAFELHLNGTRVGDHRLDPAQSNYHRRSYYVTFDVTGLLESDNCFAVVLGNGRYLPAYGFGRPKLFLQAAVEFQDGTGQSVLSGANWKSTSGPIRENGIYYGERYDARLTEPGWDMPGHDRSAWEPVVEAPPVPLRSQLIQPIRVTEVLKARSMKRIRPGSYIYDFGQNISGVVRLRTRAPSGTRIVMRFAELLAGDGSLNRTTLRNAVCTDVYVAAGGGEEIWEPLFTYHGFRYVELSGTVAVPDLSTIEALVLHTDVSVAGTLSLGSDLLAAAHRNIVWGQRSNLMSIPTDCPQRDERQGWLGDAQLAAEEAIFNFDMARFYWKYVDDIRDSQREDGSIPDVVPPYWQLYPADPAWGTAYVQLVWLLYWYYGDERPILDHFDGMHRYVKFLAAMAEDGIIRKLGRYGDWCPPGSILPKRTPIELTSTWYYYNDVLLLSRMAEAVGRGGDAEELRQQAVQIKDAFNREFLTEHGYATIRMAREDQAPGQTSNLLPLYLDMVPESARDGIVGRLLEAVLVQQDRHVDTGIIGTRYLFDVLTNVGHHEAAFEIATQRTYPGFGYMLGEGATTLWERWECLTGAGMNSHNHIMLGSVDAWMYRVLAGLVCEEPGWKRITVKPNPAPGLDWAAATVSTVRGIASVSWERTENEFHLTAEIPAGAEAEICIPCPEGEKARLYAGETLVYGAGSISGGGIDGGAKVYREADYLRVPAKSGFHSFRATFAPAIWSDGVSSQATAVDVVG